MRVDWKEQALMADHHPNATYVEAMSAILIQFFVPPAGEDDLVHECVGQLVETYLFDGLHEYEAARIVSSQLRFHRSELSVDDRSNWVRTKVDILPSELKERTFAMLTYRIYFANDGKLDDEAADLLDRAAKLLGLTQRQTEKILEVCEVLTRPIA
jgi:hypothetical protein